MRGLLGRAFDVVVAAVGSPGILRSAAGILTLVISSQTSFAQTASVPGSFRVNNTGAASYSIPIAVPPGTAGVAPSLTLSYSSQSGNGILGMGWSLDGLPSVGRCPKTLVQDGVIGGVNYDANDRFCFEGQRLVAISGTYGADGTEYRTEIDSFSRIVSRGTAGTGPGWFEVRTKSGQVMEFGHTADSQILAQGKATARSWAMNRLSDTKSNYLTVTYVNDNANGQAYPSRIDYTGNMAASLAPYNSVQFVYATRTDITPEYQAGSLKRTTVRLTNLQTFTGGALTADYRLAYQQSGARNRSRITSVTLCEGGGSCLPATTVNWTGDTSGLAAVAGWNNEFTGATGWTDDNTYPRHFVDVNGDGRPDIVGFASNGVQVALNTGTSFATAQLWIGSYGTSAGSWTDSNLYPRHLADVNGDGLPDVVGFASNGVHVSLNTGTSFAAAQVWIYNFSTGVGGYIDNNIHPRHLADVNGDGLPDVVGFGPTGVQVSLNTGTSFAAPQLWASSYGTNTGWATKLLYPRMMADVNGDGLPDVVGFGPNGVEVSLNTGTSFGASQLWIAAYGASASAGSWSDNNIYPRMMVDVNGDGLPDIVGFGSNGVQVSLNTGTSFATPQLWIGAYGTNAGGWSDNNTYPRMLADMNGDGLPDVVGFAGNGVLVSLNSGTGFAASQVWINNYGTGAGGWVDNNTYPRATIDALGTGFSGIVGFGAGWVPVAVNTGSNLPDMVSSVTNGLGATTTITYKPGTNTTVVTKGTGTTFPTLDLVGPLYVVSRVDASNGIGGNYSSTYTYSGGRINLRGRGFLGFAQTSVKDLQTNIVQTTTYRQDFPYIAMAASETKAVGAQTLNQASNTLQFLNASGAATLSTPNNTSAPYRVSVAQSVSSSFDLDGSAMPTSTTTYQYDAYNNATQVVVSTSDGYSKTTNNTYTNDATNWLLGRLTAATVTAQAPLQLGQYCSLPWGGTIANGQSTTAYSAAIAPVGQVCSAFAQTRTCTNGTLSGSYTQGACTPAACTLPWGGSIASGQSVTAYSSAGPVGQSCGAVAQTRTCTNGTLSGSYGQQSCTALCAKPGGGTISSGQSLVAYSRASVMAPLVCLSYAQTRTCTDGTLSGSSTMLSCAVLQPNPKRIVLTSGSAWTVPADWNAGNNSIEVIGGGGGGGANGRAGGAGGGYSKITNLSLTPAGSVAYAIGAGGAQSAPGVTGGDTWFNGASLAASSVGAKGGTGGGDPVGGIGGAAASGIGTTKFSGGNGGAGTTLGYRGGGGGGGAGGPNGNGIVGSPAPYGAELGGVGGVGGAGANGSGGAGGGANSAGRPGSQFNGSHGSGGGGGGGTNGAAGGNGGLYGAGGGGGGFGFAGGAGSNGIIVITYMPAQPSGSIYLTSGSSWTVPGDWNNANNKIEVIGGGGSGGVAYGGGGSGGGGGAYSSVSNLALTPGASPTFSVGLGGTGGYGAAGTNTWFNGTSLSAASVSAQGGTGGLNNAFGSALGGQAASGIGTIKFSGGNGAGGGNGGGAGGGAAGPHGSGGAGGHYGGGGYTGGGGGGGADGGSAGANGYDTIGGSGGNGWLGNGGGVGNCNLGGVPFNGGGGSGGYGYSCGGGVGSMNSAFDATHGSGGGGGGGGSSYPNTGRQGGNGATYGGGGGGGGTINAIGGNGANGIVVITYTPAF
jgi:hypothetical protein